VSIPVLRQYVRPEPAGFAQLNGRSLEVGVVKPGSGV